MDRPTGGIGLGQHRCFIYRGVGEYLSRLKNLLGLCLDRRWKIVYVADHDSVQQLRGVLKTWVQGGITVREGQLSLLDTGKIFPGSFDPEPILNLVKKLEFKALESGFQGLLFMIDMTFVSSKLLGIEKLEEYERMLGDWLKGSRASAVCCYNEMRFEPDVLLDVISLHADGSLDSGGATGGIGHEGRSFEDRALAISSEVSSFLAYTVEVSKNELKELMEILRRKFEYTEWSLYVLEGRGRKFRLLASTSKGEGATPIWVDVDDAMLREAIRGQGPVYIRDLREVRSRFLLSEKSRSAYIIPIFTEGNATAVLSLESERADGISEEDRRVIRHIVPQISAAVERYRNLSKDRRRLRQLETISVVNREIGSVLDLETLLKREAELIHDILGYHNVNIFVADSERGVLTLRAAKGGYRGDPPLGEEINIEDGLVGWTARTGRTALVPDVSVDRRYYHYGGLPNMRSELTIPIKRGRETLGVLDVQSMEIDAFDESDVLTLSTVADQLGAAIDRARLYGKLEERSSQLENLNRRLTALVENMATITGSLDLREVLQKIVDTCTGKLGYRQVILSLVEGDALRAYVSSHRDNRKSAHIAKAIVDLIGIRPSDMVFPLTDADNLSVRAVLSSTPVITDDLSKAIGKLAGPVSRKLLGIKSAALLPMRFKGRAIGLLYVASTHRIREDELQVLSLFAEQAAVAVENARLHNELERKSRSLDLQVKDRTLELETLYKLSQRIGAAIDHDELFEIVNSSLPGVVGYDVCGMVVLAEEVPYIRIWSKVPVSEKFVRSFRESLIKSLRDITDIDQTRLTASELKVLAPTEAPGKHPLSGEETSLPSTFPLAAGQETLGILRFFSSEGSFTGDQLRVLQTVANQVSISVQKIKTSLEREKTRLEAMVEGIADGVVLLDSRGKPMAHNVLGMKLYREICSCRGDMIGSDCPIHGPSEPVTSGDGETVPRELKKGENIYEIRFSKVPLSTPGAYGTVVNIRDVTKEKSAQQQILQSSKMAAIGELAAGVAHEINNPLTAVIGFSDLWLRRNIDNEKLRSDLEKIYEAGSRAAEIVKNLLSFSRNQRQAERGPVSVNEAVKSSLELIRSRYEKEGIAIDEDLAEDLPYIFGNCGQIQQVVLNLVSNARDAILDSGKGGRIEVRTRRSDKTVLLEVSDDGPGIPEELCEKIFEPFFTTKSPGKGTGLGLSITYSIIREHGGNISLRSGGKRGTTFVVELPVAMDAMSPQERPDGNRLPDVPPKEILVIDDEETILDFIGSALRANGHNVTTTISPYEAMDLVRGKDFDLIFLDFRMPGSKGSEIYENLKLLNPRIADRVVILTGDIMSEDVASFLKSSGLPSIMKPVGLKDLREFIAGFFSERTPD